MRIVFAASEVLPFAKTGGLADVCGALPVELEAAGHEVSIIMPYYKEVGVKKVFNDRAQVDVIGQDIKVYFIKHKAFFGRSSLYGDNMNDYPDNLERFAFFCRQALELLKEIGKPVDIIHCHDWQTGLIPLLLKAPYAGEAFFSATRTVFTIHNLAYQGVFPKEEYAKLGLEEKFFNDSQVEFYGKVNLLKAGIVFSDYVTTVSPQYAKEIQTREWGCGLEGVLQSRKGRLAGILNGLDYERWNPERDVFIDPAFSARDQLAKKIHREKLQKVAGLPVLADIPVFGFVGRLCYQKGFDLIEGAFEELMHRPIQLVFLGVGEKKYQELLKKLARKNPQRFAALVRYDEDIAHQVYAGADFFLMPSVYEPCGLTQMIALRYGAIPLVSGVGGFLDTVSDCGVNKKQGNGFVLSSYSVSGLLEALDRALGLYNQKEKLAALIAQAMDCRFTWQSSVKHFNEVYAACRS
ncbi:MAG: glycogen synthase GlgA [Candidatus Omnitrophica bacterium]|nr:glycogen synthase GlgA [Candidatus Omnitrophota bacterium]